MYSPVPDRAQVVHKGYPQKPSAQRGHEREAPQPEQGGAPPAQRPALPVAPYVRSVERAIEAPGGRQVAPGHVPSEHQLARRYEASRAPWQCFHFTG